MSSCNLGGPREPYTSHHTGDGGETKDTETNGEHKPTEKQGLDKALY